MNSKNTSIATIFQSTPSLSSSSWYNSDGFWSMCRYCYGACYRSTQSLLWHTPIWPVCYSNKETYTMPSCTTRRQLGWFPPLPQSSCAGMQSVGNCLLLTPAPSFFKQKLTYQPLWKLCGAGSSYQRAFLCMYSSSDHQPMLGLVSILLRAPITLPEGQWSLLLADCLIAWLSLSHTVNTGF